MKKILSAFFLSLQCAAFAETDAPQEENQEAQEAVSNCECNPCDTPLNLTLEFAINRALTANRQILTSVNALQSSQLRLELAYSEFDLKMKPLGKSGYSGGGDAGNGIDIGLGLTWDKKFSTGTKVHISPFARKMEKKGQVDIDASIIQPLLKGFNREYNLSSLRSAQQSARSAIRNLHIAQVGMVTKTITAIYELIKLQKGLEIQKECCHILSKYYKIVKQKEERELAESSDLIKIETELQQQEDTIHATEAKIKESQDIIRELLVLDIGQCFELNVPLAFQKCQIDCEEAIKLALMYRTEIEQSNDDYGEKIRLSKVAKENLKPDLDLVIRVNNTGYGRYFRDTKKEPETTWTFNLTSTSDYERASEKISYDQSLVAIDSARTSLEQTREKIILEVKRAFRNLNRAAENIQLQESKIVSFKGELKLQQRKYEKGQVKSSDIMKTEQSICSAQISLIGAIIDQIIGEYALKASMGLLIEKPIVNS